MLLLTVTGMIGWLARVIPKAVIRGIQFGLGAKLALLALSNYVQADGPAGYIPAFLAFAVTIGLMGNRKIPAALVVIAIGLVYAFATHLDLEMIAGSAGFSLPRLHTPRFGDIAQGFLLLALPQIPLSLGNSIFATKQIAEDLFPERHVTVKKIGTTYSLMNIVAPFLSGLPVCHGSGGIAGHHAFGARTGGSAFIYGVMLASLGLFFGHGFADVIKIFPLPILGVILLFEGLALMRFIRDTAGSSRDLFIALLTGTLAVGLPYGFLIGMIVGSAAWYWGAGRRE